MANDIKTLQDKRVLYKKHGETEVQSARVLEFSSDKKFVNLEYRWLETAQVTVLEVLPERKLTAFPAASVDTGDSAKTPAKTLAKTPAKTAEETGEGSEG